MSLRSLALPPSRAWSAQVDRVWLASATMLLVLFLLVPAQGQASLAFAAASLLEVLPYLLAVTAPDRPARERRLTPPCTPAT